MRRPSLIAALFVCSLVEPAFAKHVSLHGFVTAVNSPLSFQMDQYNIIDETEAEYRRIRSEGRDYRPPQLQPGTLRVGLEVEVKGEYDPKTSEVKATAIKAVNDDSVVAKMIEGMGLVEEATSLRKASGAWSGTLAADGEKLVLASDTAVTVKRTRSERKERENLGLEQDVSSFSPDDIDLGTFAQYEGVRQADHSILLKRIEFRQDRAGSESDWSFLDPKVTYEPSHYDTGTLHIGEKEYQLFPSPETSVYLEKLAISLIPARQRSLAENSPARVKFRFFLMKSDLFEVDTYPNGVVVMSVKVFDLLDNEAQLAFVLSHEMARLAEKQHWTASKYHEKERQEAEFVGVASSLIVPGGSLVGFIVDKSIAHKFQRSLQNQADRIGIADMLAAGYDPNESVEAWRVLEKKRAKGPFWGDSDVNLTRRTYLASELRLDYAGQDFSSLKRDSTDFHAAVAAVKAARVRAKIKKK